MESIANRSAKTIWLVEHSTDNIWLLKLLLEKWGYNIVRIQDSDVLSLDRKDQTVKPQLVIISIALSQRNAIKLIQALRQDAAFCNIPLMCLRTSGKHSKSQLMAVGASYVLNRPFELEELHLKLKQLMKPETNSDQSKYSHGMTFLLPETESASLIPQQQYWSEVFHQHSEPDAWKLLAAEGYEVKVSMKSK